MGVHIASYDNYCITENGIKKEGIRHECPIPFILRYFALYGFELFALVCLYHFVVKTAHSLNLGGILNDYGIISVCL